MNSVNKNWPCSLRLSIHFFLSEDDFVSLKPDSDLDPLWPYTWDFKKFDWIPVDSIRYLICTCRYSRTVVFCLKSQYHPWQIIDRCSKPFIFQSEYMSVFYISVRCAKILSFLYGLLIKIGGRSSLYLLSISLVACFSKART